MRKVLSLTVRLIPIGVIAVVFLALSGSASAVDSIGVGAVPANPNPANPRSSSIFVYDSIGGQTLSDAVKVTNNTDKQKTISLYAVDSQGSSDGAFACAQAVDDKKGVGSWITLATSEVSLGPFSNQVVPFTVAIPQNADAGEHNGCIVIQDASDNARQRSGNVVLSFRSAIRVAVTVPGDITTKLSLLRVERSSGQNNSLLLSPVYKNEGNVSLDTTINVALTSVIGTTLQQQKSQFPILSQTEARFNFEFKPLFWGGFYRQTVDTSYIKLSDQGKPVEPQSLSTSTQWIFIKPQPLALVIEIVLLGLALATTLYFIRRRRQKKQLTAKLVLYKVKTGDNLQSIAKKAHVSWQLLAKINRLKPPYSLTVGASIKVPVRAKKPAKKRG